MKNESNELFYRLRGIDALIGNHHELEDQEIFFPRIEDLNDPMEGCINYFWYGDNILWQNLIKHYILCLDHMCVLSYFSEDSEYDSFEIPILKSVEDLPSDKYKKMFDEILDIVFRYNGVKRLIEYLVQQGKVYEKELKVYLSILHPIVLNAIFTVQYKNKLIKKKTSFEANLIDVDVYIKRLNEIKEDTVEENDIIKEYMEAQADIIEESNLIQICDTDSIKESILLFEFVEAYLKKIKDMTYPDTYVSCFMKNINNSALWGHYADNHKGVALIFKFNGDNENRYLSLYGVNGIRGGKEKSKDTFGNFNIPLQKINYKKEIPEVNFFKSLGKLSQYNIDNYWFKDNKGNISEFIEWYDNTNKDGDWRFEYWKNNNNSYTTKFKEWKDEREYRLILIDGLRFRENEEYRKFKYDFNDLNGIVFGYKTNLNDKKRILEIIKKKCKDNNRKDFKIYQAEFSLNKRKIEIREMKLLQQKM